MQVFPLFSFRNWIYVLPCKLFLVLEQLIQIFCRLLGFQKIFHDITFLIHGETCFFFQLTVSLDNELTIVRREKLTSIFKKCLEPTNKIYLIFWLVPQTPLFFFDFWGINLVRTAEVTQNLLACAKRKKKISLKAEWLWVQLCLSSCWNWKGRTLFWKISSNLEEES